MTEHDDFLQIPRGVSQASTLARNLEAIQVVRFERGSNEMHWKESNIMNFKVQNFYSESMLKVQEKAFVEWKNLVKLPQRRKTTFCQPYSHY